MWYHLSLFLDAGELGVAYAGVTTATALSQVLGGPMAAALLLLDGTLGLHGWQWLFLCEGLPTIAFGVVLKVSWLAQQKPLHQMCRPFLLTNDTTAAVCAVVRCDSASGTLEGSGHAPA